jgi:hypothetical protein
MAIGKGPKLDGIAIEFLQFWFIIMGLIVTRWCLNLLYPKGSNEG